MTLRESCSLDIELLTFHIGARITIFRVRRLRPTCLLLVFSYFTLLFADIAVMCYATCLVLPLSLINGSFLLDGPAVNNRTELAILPTCN